MITRFKKFEKLEEEDEFILYPVGTSVVCIDDDGASGIEKGKIYEIEEIKNFEYSTSYYKDYYTYKLVDKDAYYIANRFVDELEYNVKRYNL